MPSNLPADNSVISESPGTLFVVATPIGNMDDITLRAIQTLRAADIIAAEDTRHTGNLLAHLNIRTRLISYHEHNEKIRSEFLIEKLGKGTSVALVSDAGTPSISDPGYRLVNAAVKRGIRVVPIPGVSAAITALSVSGLPTDAFVFMGFPPKKKSRRHDLLKQLSLENKTVIFYESPRRLVRFIEEVIRVSGDRYGVLSREMTKYHEEFLRGTLSEILDQLKQREIVKGECTLVISGSEKLEASFTPELRAEIEDRLKKGGIRPSALAKEMARKYGIPKSKIYEQTVRLNDQLKK